ncbi:MAG: DUF5615 family PIN-like protein [Pirellulales bacterium]
MGFKVDENLPVEVADILRASGYNAVTVLDQHLVGAVDPMVAGVCKSEDRALITLDLDFSDIRTYPPSDYPGIIILRPHTQSKRDVLALVNKLIPFLDGRERLIGTLWIVQEAGIRVREGNVGVD